VASGFDYSLFLSTFKRYAFETISTVLVTVSMVELAVRELEPAIKRILKCFRAN